MRHDELAVNNFLAGYNCSQAVLLAFAKDIGLDENIAKKLSSSFGGGMGRLREVCGALSGAFMVIGFIYGDYPLKDNVKKAEHYKKVQEIAAKFKEYNGSIICKELLGLNLKGADNYVPEIRTNGYYKKRPCPEIIRKSAQILDELYFSDNK